MLQIAVSPALTMMPGDRLDNDKVNLAAAPVMAVSGGLEDNQVKLGPYFYGDTTGSVNSYYLHMTEADQDPTAIVEGCVAVFKVPTGLTNTDAATLGIVKSDGVTVLAGVKIKKRGGARDVSPGDLVEGGIYACRFDGSFWQLVTCWSGVGNGLDLAPDQYFYAGTGSGTSTAWSLSATPAPTALKAAMHVFVSAPAANLNGSLTLNLNGLGALPVRKRGGLNLVAGDLQQGGMYLLVLSASADYWEVANLQGANNGMIGAHSGLVVKWTNVSTVQATADALTVENPTTRQTVTLQGVNVSAAFGTTGAGGLDGGGEAANTWYYIWVIYNSATGTSGALLSASSSNPGMPSGYDYRALVGAARNNGSSDLIDFFQAGREVWVGPQTIFTGKHSAVANTYEALAGADLTAFQAAVPPNAKAVSGFAGGEDASGVGYIGIAADANGMGACYVVGSFGSAMDGFTSAGMFRVPLKTAQTLLFKTGNTTNAHGLKVTGYSY